MATDAALFEAARAVRWHAHAPYSNFFVGAAIVDEAGRTHVGCNVENAAYPQGACAEANAIGAMIAAGGRQIRTIAVVGGHAAEVSCTPCGGCRQRIREFADAETRILIIGAGGQPQEQGIEALLPASFGPGDLRVATGTR